MGAQMSLSPTPKGERVIIFTSVSVYKCWTNLGFPPQLIGISKHKNDKNSVKFTGTELTFDVEVAESHQSTISHN